VNYHERAAQLGDGSDKAEYSRLLKDSR
jgi:hypothetical protein